MSLTKQQVEHIANLARLELSEEEKARFEKQLSGILDYVSQLSQVATEGVEPLSHVSPVVNAWRADEVVACTADERERLLEAFPERDGDLLKVKAVFS
ncbi:MAG: Asp-tRNA(Asn)/Glu-tRNA(Gln) amidotransferase subunit GatC [Patescibacteria group bacterium]|nr:Asp-tRNA(Asn)/Glu-tRNA(Gln) amidotransferase subunit GatC [Patescibacteria group bacterium]